MTHWLPWAKFNLRRNPFGELSQAERIELAVVDVSELTEHLAPYVAVQLVGGRGRGKTTRMLKIASQFPESWYVYLPETGRCPAIQEGRPLLIDEAQRLSRAACRAVFSTGLPLVLATHRGLQRRLRRYGYRVYSKRIGDGNTPELVFQALNRRIEASRLHAGPVPGLSRCVAKRLVMQFGSDLRAMESHLYERTQIQVLQHGEVQFVD